MHQKEKSGVSYFCFVVVVAFFFASFLLFHFFLSVSFLVFNIHFLKLVTISIIYSQHDGDVNKGGCSHDCENICETILTLKTIALPLTFP